MEATVIVSRHSGAVEWLRQKGIEGEVVVQATAENIRRKHVVGNLPIELCSEALSVTLIRMSDQPREKRGQDLSPEQMDIYGAELCTFMVKNVRDRRDAEILAHNGFYE